MGVTTEKGETGNDPRRRGSYARSAARVHKMADTPQTAKLMGVSERRVRQWKCDGFGSPQDQYDRHFRISPQNYYAIAHLKSVAKQEEIRVLSDAELIARFHELRELEKTMEGEDNCIDMRRGVSWGDRAHMKRRDAAIDEELAAVCDEMEARGLTEEGVFK